MSTSKSTRTAGQALAAELRRYFSLGPRTRRTRRGADLHHDMVHALHAAATMPGYFTDRTHALLRPGFGAALSYAKHVRGVRIRPVLAYEINALSPWRFAALLGDMVDAGVTNTGEGEQFFARMRHASPNHSRANTSPNQEAR